MLPRQVGKLGWRLAHFRQQLLGAHLGGRLGSSIRACIQLDQNMAGAALFRLLELGRVFFEELARLLVADLDAGFQRRLRQRQVLHANQRRCRVIGLVRLELGCNRLVVDACGVSKILLVENGFVDLALLRQQVAQSGRTGQSENRALAVTNLHLLEQQVLTDHRQ